MQAACDVAQAPLGQQNGRALEQFSPLSLAAPQLAQTCLVPENMLRTQKPVCMLQHEPDGHSPSPLGHLVTSGHWDARDTQVPFRQQIPRPSGQDRPFMLLQSGHSCLMGVVDLNTVSEQVPMDVLLGCLVQQLL